MAANRRWKTLRLAFTRQALVRLGDGLVRLGMTWVFEEQKMRFDFDVSNLERGDVIGVSTCEQILGCRHGTVEFAQRQMYLSKWLEKELWRIGKQISVCICGAEIKLLTHAEASEYADSVYETGRRKIRLAHKRACAVDLGELSEERRTEHLKSVMRMANVIGSFRRKELPQLKAVKPLLPSMRR